MPRALREAYVAGVIDTISAIATPETASAAKHYNDCIVKSGMNLGQTAEAAKEFMEMHPELRDRPASNTIVRYLIALCGVPIPNEGTLLKRSLSAEITGPSVAYSTGSPVAILPHT